MPDEPAHLCHISGEDVERLIEPRKAPVEVGVQKALVTAIVARQGIDLREHLG